MRLTDLIKQFCDSGGEVSSKRTLPDGSVTVTLATVIDSPESQPFGKRYGCLTVLTVPPDTDYELSEEELDAVRRRFPDLNLGPKPPIVH